MDLTPQIYFAKLVDVQFDYDVIASPFGKNSYKQAVPEWLLEKGLEERLAQRYWPKIAYPENKALGFGYDEPSAENFARLSDFQIDLKTAIEDILNDAGGHTDAPGDQATDEIRRLRAAIVFDMDKMKTAASERSHYLRHGAALYISYLDREGMDGWKAFSKNFTARLDRSEKQYKDLIDPLKEQAPALLQHGNAAQLARFDVRLRETIEKLKQIRIDAEYKMQENYVKVLQKKAAPRQPASAVNFQP